MRVCRIRVTKWNREKFEWFLDDTKIIKRHIPSVFGHYSVIPEHFDTIYKTRKASLNMIFAFVHEQIDNLPISLHPKVKKKIQSKGLSLKEETERIRQAIKTQVTLSP